MKAVDAAKEIYEHGKHVSYIEGERKEILSLRSLATSTKRELVPSFTLFKTYYKSSNYADNLIAKVFEENALFQGSNDQYSALIVDVLKYQVLFMAAIQKIYEAISGCESQSESQGIQAQYDWDTAAAFIIGSMQKSSASLTSTNAEDGYLLWDLGLNLCQDFNKCLSSDVWAAVNNEKILDALYIGSFELSQKSQMSQRSCTDIVQLARQIEKNLQIVLLQGTLKAAYQVDRLVNDPQNDSFTTQDRVFAAGYVYSRAILPYIHDVDEAAASTINENLNFQFEEGPVVDGYKMVFDAVFRSLDKLGISCNDIGYLSNSNYNGCTRVQSRGSYWNDSFQAFLFIPIVYLLI